MHSLIADGRARLLSWRRVREFAVPALMIKTATARRNAGDWAGACAAAHFDVDLDLRSVASGYGRECAALIRADLRRLAPDLVRWHLPRTVSDGLLRPGLTMSLARYPVADHDVHLVVRTAPSWAEAGQRVSLALWDPTRPGTGPHPRPRPDRRFRLDLHPHLWAADRAPDLRERCDGPATEPDDPARPAWIDEVPAGRGYAVHRWTAEAAMLRDADGYGGPVAVRLGNGRRLLLTGDGGTVMRAGNGAPVLPHAATWLPPDLELLRAGMITAAALHPLVAEALASVALGDGDRVDGAAPAGYDPGPGTDGSRLVECCGEVHRLGLVDGRLTPLDHEAGELRREELLALLGGPPLPCLRAVTTAARQPECLDEVRARLNHGDHAGATAVIAGLLGPDLEPEGALREVLTEAEAGRIDHGLYRAGLATGVNAPIGSPKDRAGRRGRHHRLPKNRLRLPKRAAVLR